MDTPIDNKAASRVVLRQDDAQRIYRWAEFRTDFRALLAKGHKWDVILAGIAEVLGEDSTNMGPELASLSGDSFTLIAKVIQECSQHVILSNQQK